MLLLRRMRNWLNRIRIYGKNITTIVLFSKCKKEWRWIEQRTLANTICRSSLWHLFVEALFEAASCNTFQKWTCTYSKLYVSFNYLCSQRHDLKFLWPTMGYAAESCLFTTLTNKRIQQVHIFERTQRIVWCTFSYLIIHILVSIMWVNFSSEGEATKQEGRNNLARMQNFYISLHVHNMWIETARRHINSWKTYILFDSMEAPLYSDSD